MKGTTPGRSPAALIPAPHRVPPAVRVPDAAQHVDDERPRLPARGRDRETRGGTERTEEASPRHGNRAGTPHEAATRSRATTPVRQPMPPAHLWISPTSTSTHSIPASS